MHIKPLFRSSPTKRLRGEISSLAFHDYLNLLNINALLQYSVLRKFASSLNLINQSEREWNNYEKVFKTEDRIFAANTCVVA